MSTFKSSLTSIKYHAITRPLITAAINSSKKGAEKLKAYALARRNKGRYNKNPADIKAKVRKFTRGEAIHDAKYFSKNSQAGRGRRLAAATAARATRNASKAPANVMKIAQKDVVSPKKHAFIRQTPHKTLAKAIHSSKTHGQLRRKITGLAVRDFSKRMGNSRNERAHNIRLIRKTANPKGAVQLGHGDAKSMIRAKKNSLQKKAAEVLSRRKPKA